MRAHFPVRSTAPWCCLFLLSWTALGCADLDAPRGGADGATTRAGIRGGQETRYETFRGVVAVSSPTGQICTGTLIDPAVVLTAAHCVFAPSHGLDGTSKAAFKIYGGADLDKDDERMFYSDVSASVTHPAWDGALDSVDDVDLALLQLEAPVTSLETYALDTVDGPTTGDTGVIVGYGEEDTDGGMSTSRVHRMGEATVLGQRGYYLEIGGPATAAPGDSGGPFFTRTDQGPVVSGVISFNDSDGQPSSETAWCIGASKFGEWIQKEKTALQGGTSRSGDRGCGVAGCARKTPGLLAPLISLAIGQ